MLRSTNLADRSAAQKSQLNGAAALLAETLQKPDRTWRNLPDCTGDPGTRQNPAELGGTRVKPGGNLAETRRKESKLKGGLGV